MAKRITQWWKSNFPDDKGFILFGSSYDEEDTSCDRCGTSIKNTVEVKYSRNNEPICTVGTRCADIVTQPYTLHERLAYIEPHFLGANRHMFDEPWVTEETQDSYEHHFDFDGDRFEIKEDFRGCFSGTITYKHSRFPAIRFSPDDPTDEEGLRVQLLKQYRKTLNKTP